MEHSEQEGSDRLFDGSCARFICLFSGAPFMTFRALRVHSSSDSNLFAWWRVKLLIYTPSHKYMT